MVEIEEKQFNNNIENYQERTIVYKSWNDYVDDLCKNTLKMAYPTIPRNVKIDIIHKSDNELIYSFNHFKKSLVFGYSKLV